MTKPQKPQNPLVKIKESSLKAYHRDILIVEDHGDLAARADVECYDAIFVLEDLRWPVIPSKVENPRGEVTDRHVGAIRSVRDNARDLGYYSTAKVTLDETRFRVATFEVVCQLLCALMYEPDYYDSVTTHEITLVASPMIMRYMPFAKSFLATLDIDDHRKASTGVSDALSGTARFTGDLVDQVLDLKDRVTELANDVWHLQLDMNHIERRVDENDR